MGRSGGSASCLKLIPCAGGNGSVDRDDLGAPESKGSSDRSKWSFRKKSARHRVLSSNSAASEAPSENKATPDSVATGFATQSSSTTPEKSLAVQWKEEKSVLEFPVDTKVSETIETTAATAAEEYGRTDESANDNKWADGTVDDDIRVDGTAADDVRADGNAEEESVIIIQAAVRRFLAQRSTLLKHDNIIKVQAAVRGHIVRKHAVGSLRCVQAIVKMQKLVRERHSRLHGSGIKEDVHGKTDIVGKEPDFTYVSIEKLLSNAFARKLMESTPKTKRIDIKCDPSKPDLGWKWLERWMLPSSTEAGQSPGLEPNAELQAKGNTDKADSHWETVVSSPENCQSRDGANFEALQAPLEADENVITYDVDKNKFHDCQPIVLSVDQTIDELQPQLIGEANSSVSDVDSSTAGHTRQLDRVSETEAVPTNEMNLPILDTSELEGSEIDGKKSSTGSRKASNPSFIAAQAKFEGLGSAASLEKSTSSSNQEGSVDSPLESDLPVNNHSSKTRAIDHSESSLAHNLIDPVTGSECGTELSISSTLDSPDRSDAGVVVSDRETRNLEKVALSPKNDLDLEVEEKMESNIVESNLTRIEENGGHNSKNDIDLEVEEKIGSDFTRYSEDGAHNLISDFNSVVEEKIESKILKSDAADSNPVGHDLDYSENVSSIMADHISEVEQRPANVATDIHVEQETESIKPARRFSPQPSPTKSHVTVPESQGTPSSQVSVMSKNSKSGKGKSKKHLASGKESHLESSSEHQNGKRRNSFGSSKAADHSDQEPRDSSNSLPSYMQATKSARAKALSLNSPRSSPDMQDKDLIKKRQSLPGASTRQGSPHVHRAQHGAKANGTHSPQERKWKR